MVDVMLDVWEGVSDGVVEIIGDAVIVCVTVILGEGVRVSDGVLDMDCVPDAVRDPVIEEDGDGSATRL